VHACDDVVEGKGQGLIALLQQVIQLQLQPKYLTTGHSGPPPPRVGKTLTAEAVGELLHRPLYYVCDFPRCLLLLCRSRRFLPVSSISKQKLSKTACPLSFHWHTTGMPCFFWMKQKCTWSNESGRTSSSEVDRGNSFIRNRPHNEYDTGSAETDSREDNLERRGKDPAARYSSLVSFSTLTLLAVCSRFIARSRIFSTSKVLLLSLNDDHLQLD
jgi:hypothetical protein